MWKLLVALCLLIAAPLHAATYYIATTGNDARSCATAQTITTPKASFDSGMACLGPGDTLFVRAGTYNEGINNNVPSGTSWAAPVRIAAYQSDIVWLSPGTTTQFGILFTGNQHYIEIDGINLQSSQGVPGFGGSFKIGCFADTGSNPHHIRYKNAEIVIGTDGIPNQGTMSAAVGVLVSANYGGTIGGNEFTNLNVHGGGDPGDFAAAFYIENDHNLIDHNNAWGISGWALQSWNDYGFDPVGNIISNNIVHDITRSADGRFEGIVNGGIDTQIFNNIVYNIGTVAACTTCVGIYVYKDNANVYNNTVYSVKMEGIVDEIFSSGSHYSNNVSYNNVTNDFRNSGSGAVLATNMFLGVNPLFMNAGSADFRLQASSPGRNTGTAVGIVTTDIIGSSRPQEAIYDIGAYEYVAAAGPTAPHFVSLLGVGR